MVRGPQWMWGEQDGGVGTVGTVHKVSKSRPGLIKVLWPNRSLAHYRYGLRGAYDVQVRTIDESVVGKLQ